MVLVGQDKRSFRRRAIQAPMAVVRVPQPGPETRVLAHRAPRVPVVAAMKTLAQVVVVTLVEAVLAAKATPAHLQVSAALRFRSTLHVLQAA